MPTHTAKFLGAILVTACTSHAAYAQHAPVVATVDETLVSSTTDTSTALLPEQIIHQTQIVSTTLNNHLTNIQTTRALDGVQISGLPMSGISAGENQTPLGQNISAWVSYSRNETENDAPGIAYESDTDSVSVGLDFILGGPLTVGFFVSQSWTDTDSSFNRGGSDTESTTFGPYISVTVTDWLALDASFGHTSSSTDNRRVTAVGTTVTGTQDGTTNYYSFGAGLSHWFEGGIGLSGRAGYNNSNTKNDAYTDSTATAIAATKSNLAQIQVGGRAMYYTQNFMPYVGVTYINDVKRDKVRTAANPQPANDEDDVLIQTGLSLYGETAFSGSLDFNYNAAREQNDAWGVGGNVSYRF
ncbi:autotransporter outer membrane beta-barrel domain-containing protein [Pyruvatibacter sp.]|uniref:autotransporter outer membrane beta-barrel domain-containing protein n=1 Tax=Pyruvatibacter sp. TaxID=1981328 RepID=UPI0032652832